MSPASAAHTHVTSGRPSASLPGCFPVCWKGGDDLEGCRADVVRRVSEAPGQPGTRQALHARQCSLGTCPDRQGGCGTQSTQRPPEALELCSAVVRTPSSWRSCFCLMHPRRPFSSPRSQTWTPPGHPHTPRTSLSIFSQTSSPPGFESQEPSPLTFSLGQAPTSDPTRNLLHLSPE